MIGAPLEWATLWHLRWDQVLDYHTQLCLDIVNCLLNYRRKLLLLCHLKAMADYQEVKQQLILYVL